jgi:hypothetical protein
MATAGYSGTPLPKKLGIKEGDVVGLVAAPPELEELLGELPPGVTFQDGVDPVPDFTLAFFTERSALAEALPALVEASFPDRAVWLAWPKKTSGVATDLTGDVVRELVLGTTLVDVKVCAISEVWSGQKAVWRKEHRAR